VHLYLNACDVLVFSSLQEGSPNIIKEALACNCPIVATDVGDVSERIRNIPGCYIADFTPGDFSCNIVKALDFNGRTNGRASLKNLSTEKVAFDIKRIYTQITDNYTRKKVAVNTLRSVKEQF
jgi:glycosyltransferase involved in cell wall biosynthesis